MEKFRTGNVVKTKTGIVIVTYVTSENTSWVSADRENSSGTSANDDRPFSGSQNVDNGDYSEEQTNSVVRGFNRNKKLANTVIERITASNLKNFNI